MLATGRGALRALAENPEPPGAFVRRGYRRLRVGDYRCCTKWKQMQSLSCGWTSRASAWAPQPLPTADRQDSRVVWPAAMASQASRYSPGTPIAPSLNTLREAARTAVTRTGAEMITAAECQ